ncbi:MAG: aminotransferase class V-fold PLP-dependent enzyme, partial [Gemmatimonadales bacterium]
MLLSWSGGKDSSLALSALRGDPRYEVVGLLTTVTADYDRISIHGVRRGLLEEQARLAELPLWEASIVAGSSNAEYEAAFLGSLAQVRDANPDVTHIAFGDLFLADVRGYRESLIGNTDFEPLFPLWMIDTTELACRFIAEGYEARLVCVDTEQLDARFAGRKFDRALLDELPEHVDPCGERGEFHTFVSSGPCFVGRVEHSVGETILRDNRFAYTDLLPLARRHYQVKATVNMRTIPDTNSEAVRSSGVDSKRDAPIAIDAEEFRKLGHELVDSLAELFDGMRDRPVAAGTTPSAIRQQLGTGGIPEKGEDPGIILAKAADILFQNSTFNGHPKFFGYITAPPAPIGVLGELLAAGVNANVGAWSLSPVATEIERQTVSWIAEFIGFPTDCGGIFVSGGNMANMVCMLVARSAKLSELSEVGGVELNGKFRIYASIETHTWIEKAVDIMGLGGVAYRKIPADEKRRIRMDALRNAVAEDKRAGLIPLAIIGTAGTVSTGDVDPLRELQALCDEEGIWFHVDGAYGAPAAALPDASEDLKALSGANSVAVDPHKWLYAPIEAGCSLIRDQSLLRQAFAHHPPYYHFGEAEGEPVFNFHEFGPQNTRGFRALKVWLALRHVG